MNILTFAKKFATPQSDLNNFQQTLLANLSIGKDVVINKGRQDRVTTTLGCFILWKTLFESGSVVGTCGQKFQGSKRLGQQIPLETYSRLPDKLRSQDVNRTNTSWEFDQNGSRVIMESLRGINFDVMIFDEAGMGNKSYPLFTKDCQHVVSYTTESPKNFDPDPNFLSLEDRILCGEAPVQPFERSYVIENAGCNLVET